MPSVPVSTLLQGSSFDGHRASILEQTWKKTTLHPASAMPSRYFVSSAFWTEEFNFVLGQSVPETVASQAPRNSCDSTTLSAAALNLYTASSASPAGGCGVGVSGWVVVVDSGV